MYFSYLKYLIKLFIICFVLFFIYIKYRKIATTFTPDIIISPSGYRGYYTLGICHYIKKHFPLSLQNKKIIGFSSGSFNGLYLTMKNREKNKKLLKLLLNMGKYKNLNEMTNKFKNKFVKRFCLNDFNNNLSVGLSHFKQLGIYNNFNTIEEMIECCYGSSFIPYVTMNRIKYIYNKKITLDGALYYKKYRTMLVKDTDTNQEKNEKNNEINNEKNNEKNKILIINPKMFGRYKKTLSIRNLIKPKCGTYQLFLFGYNDAKQHHNILKHYFE
jgi:hypothetical protein